MNKEMSLKLDGAGPLVINIELRPDGASIRLSIPLAPTGPGSQDGGAPSGFSPSAQDVGTAVRVGKASDRGRERVESPCYTRKSGECVTEPGAVEGAANSPADPAPASDVPKGDINSRMEWALDRYSVVDHPVSRISKEAGLDRDKLVDWILIARKNKDIRISSGDALRNISQ